MKKNILSVLFLWALFAACSNKNPKTEYFVEFRGFDERVQKCLSGNLINKWTSFDDVVKDRHKVTLHDEPIYVPAGKEIHVFRDIQTISENGIPRKTRKIVIESKDSNKKFSIMIFQKEDDSWRRILNAGDFRSDLAEVAENSESTNKNENLCRFIIKCVIGLTYK